MNPSSFQSSLDFNEFNSYFNSNNLLNKSDSFSEEDFFFNNNDEQSLLSQKKDIIEDHMKHNQFQLDEMSSEKYNQNYNSYNQIQPLTIHTYKDRNALTPLTSITTTNSNIINIKEEEDLRESKNDGMKNFGLGTDGIFKCDFLENISLDEDDFKDKNRKKKFDLNDSTSLLSNIINLMKEKGPLEPKTIISCLESKKDTFRKANGSKYKQDFNKLVRTILKTPDVFYKTEEGNKYFFREKKDKTEYYLKKKRERDLNIAFYNLKKQRYRVPTTLKIQLNKVNLIIKKMEKKYKGDKKYVNVMFCINMFKSLIEKYLFLVKMDKVNSVQEFCEMNEKIIDICHTLEKIEKGELYFKSSEEIVNNFVNEYNHINNQNIMFVEGDNNHFNEPPNDS